MRYGSVCSGIEAATEAWHQLGWKPSFYSEIEAFPRAVLKHHYEDVPLHGDFTTIREDDYEPIDLLVGGTPCQSFSVAGLRGGLDDDRGNLALQFLKLAFRLRPRWLVWENVPGVLSSNGGRDFGSILGGMVELGYGCAYRVLDAQFFGVPQRRRRVFLVGHLGNWQRAFSVLFERESLLRNPPPSREKRENSSQSIERGFGGSSRDRENDGGDAILKTFDYQQFGQYNSSKVSSTVSARDYKDATDLITSYRINTLGLKDGAERTEVAGSLSAEHCLSPRQGQESLALIEEIQPIAFKANAGVELPPEEQDLKEQALQAVNPMAVAFAPSKYLRGQGPDPSIEISGTINSSPHVASFTVSANSNGYAWEKSVTPTIDASGGQNKNQQYGIRQDMAVRRLTPKECERLQGFPDDYTRIPYRNKPADLCPDGPRYKALGNSMAVPVMKWIGERIQKVDKI